MHIHLVAIGTRMPPWVQEGVADYAKRLPREWGFRIQEIPLHHRGKNQPVQRLMESEGDKMLSVLAPDTRIIALDSRGHQWNTEELARQMDSWFQQGRPLAFLIGGPEGLAPACLNRAESRWSLSKLTFPHPLVRILVTEQLYRAWSLLQGHPYHR